MADETAVAAIVEYISAAKAGEILGISKRRVLEYVQAGALQSRRQRDVETRQMAVQVHAGDVERLREERENPQPQPSQAVARHGAERAGRAVALVRGVRGDADREAPLTLSDLAHKLYLTEDEAIRYTGLGRGYLREAASWRKIGARGAMVCRRVELEGL